jgi:hypothetical protein
MEERARAALLATQLPLQAANNQLDADGNSDDEGEGGELISIQLRHKQSIQKITLSNVCNWASSLTIQACTVKELIEKYRQDANVEPNSRIVLKFDGDDLDDESETLVSLDIEDGYQIDVSIT